MAASNEEIQSQKETEHKSEPGCRVVTGLRIKGGVKWVWRERGAVNERKRFGGE